MDVARVRGSRDRSLGSPVDPGNNLASTRRARKTSSVTVTLRVHGPTRDRGPVVDLSARVAAMTTLGAVFLPYLPPERLRSVAEAADSAGLEELWLWEDCFREGGISTAAAALAWTAGSAGRRRTGAGAAAQRRHHRDGAGGAAPDVSRSRHRPASAMACRSGWARSARGSASPMTLLREYTDALARACLPARPSRRLGATSARRRRAGSGRRCRRPDPGRRARAEVAALCGEIGDGLIIAGGTTPDEVRVSLRLAREGCEAAGRTGDFPVTVYLMAATGPDAESGSPRRS